jgi:hypothetical protein
LIIATDNTDNADDSGHGDVPLVVEIQRRLS